MRNVATCLLSSRFCVLRVISGDVGDCARLLTEIPGSWGKSDRMRNGGGRAPEILSFPVDPVEPYLKPESGSGYQMKESTGLPALLLAESLKRVLCCYRDTASGLELYFWNCLIWRDIFYRCIWVICQKRRPSVYFSKRKHLRHQLILRFSDVNRFSIGINMH